MARPLTPTERQSFFVETGDYEMHALPRWGQVYDVAIGHVLAFRGLGNGNLYLTLLDLSNPREQSVANEVNKPPYESPDAGLIGFVNAFVDEVERKANAAVSWLPILLIGGAALYLSRR